MAEVQRDVDARKAMVRNVINASKSLETGDSGRFIISSWLEIWANAEPKYQIPGLDNTALLCNHGKFDPSRVQASKRLASKASEDIMACSGKNS